MKHLPCKYKMQNTVTGGIATVICDDRGVWWRSIYGGPQLIVAAAVIEGMAPIWEKL